SEKFPSDLSLNSKFFAKLPDQRFLRIFARLHFAAGEFPFECVGIVASPLADQNLGVTEDQSRDHHQVGLLQFFRDQVRYANFHIFYAKSGFGLSRLMSRSLTACYTTFESIFPSRNNSYSVASVMNRASTSKKSRSDA